MVNAQGQSVIELAVKQHSLSLIQALIARGVDFNTVNGKGQSRLHRAIATFDEKKDDKAIFAIIKETHNLNHQDIHGDTPLLLSLHLGHVKIAIKLIEAGADTNLFDHVFSLEQSNAFKKRISNKTHHQQRRNKRG